MDILSSILCRYPRDCRPARIEPLGSAGGMSGAQFWRITSPRGTLALRRWPIEHPTPDHLRFIHAVIHHATNRGVDFLPVAITTCEGESFTQHAGHLWELAAWMPGTADYELSPNDAKLRAAMTTLAQFHNAVANFAPPPEVAATLRAAGSSAIPRRLARLHALTHGEFNELSSSINDSTWPEFASIARQFIATMPRAVPRAIAELEPLANIALPMQLCLRDIWHDHVLFTGNEVTGLIDFGAVDNDTPTTDIARLLGSLAGEPSLPFRERPLEVSNRSDIWREGLAAYSATRPLSRNESLAVFALNTANPILAGCNWIRWVYIERREFANSHQIITRFQRLNTLIR